MGHECAEHDVFTRSQLWLKMKKIFCCMIFNSSWQRIYDNSKGNYLFDWRVKWQIDGRSEKFLLCLGFWESRSNCICRNFKYSSGKDWDPLFPIYLLKNCCLPVWEICARKVQRREQTERFFSFAGRKKRKFLRDSCSSDKTVLEMVFVESTSFNGSCTWRSGWNL